MRTISAVRPRVSQLAANKRFTPRRLAAAMAASSLLTLSMTLSMAPAVAQVPTQPVLPTGLSVVAGQAQAVTNGNRMTVTNSSQAILNWNSFSVGAGNSVYFQQPGVTSQVLNRVTGNDPSLIMGSLGSNGRVWLLNQNGVLFGQNARVDVAGLVASTLRLNDSDWLAGRYRFTEGSNAAASVLNQGEMRTSFGGSLALVSGSVGNEGLMQAPGGQVILAAGKSVELVDTGAAYLSVRITAPEGQARNLGVLEAAGGRIDIHAAAVNQQGIVRADALTTGPGGEVWIKASDSITLAAGSRTSADGASGGSITLQADAGHTTVQGTVSAVGTSGSGGQAVVLGREVSVQDQARVDVSGALGGGGVVVGGGERGQDPRYTNAQAVYFGPQASIVADATAQGDGGHIVLWSDNATRAYGTLQARGGLLGGNGGHIETSGGWLDAQPLHVDTSAPHGQAGEWLLDPYNILISDATSTSGFSNGPVFTASGSNSAINTATINAALANANVTIYTGGNNGGAEQGNITVSSATITSNVSAPRSITFTADRAITMTDSRIRSNNGALSVTLLSAQTAGGGIGLSNTTISSGTNSWGDIVLSGAQQGQTPTGGQFGGAGGNVNYGIQLVGSALSAGTASISLVAVSNNGGSNAILVNNSTVLGNQVTLVGDAPTGVGVNIVGNSDIEAGQQLTVRGRGLAAGVHLADNVLLAVAPVTFNAAASLTLEGISRTPTGGSGVLIETTGNNSYAVLTGNGASMTIRGASDGATNDEAVRITATSFFGGTIIDAGGASGGGGNNLTIQTFGNGRNIVVDGAAGVVGGNGTTQLQAAGTISFSSNASLSLHGSTTLAAGGISLLSGFGISVDVSSLVALNLNAQGNIVLNDVGFSGGLLSLNMQAGLGGTGTVTVADSYISSGNTGGESRPAWGRPGLNASAQPNATATNGDITIGGTVAGTTPTGGSFTGAGGTGGSGVTLSNSTLNAGNANVSISGVATAQGGVGVNIDNTEIRGASVTITGDAPTGSGVVIQTASYVGADHDISVRGRGLGVGVDVNSNATVALVPPSFDATATGLIQGRALDSGGVGVRITTSGAGYAVETGSGANMVIEGAGATSGTALLLSGQTGSNGPLVDASGGGTLILRTFDDGRQVQLTMADINGGDGRVTVQAANEVNLSNAVMSSNGPVSVIAPRVLLQGTSSIESQAAGDAIVLSGSNAPMTTFLNTAGSGALIGNPGGRWIVYGTNINDTANFNAGGLNYIFTRHNAAFGAWSQDSGNGLVFSAPQTATYTGTVQNKVYDATTAATLGNVSFAFSVAGSAAVPQSSNVTFSSPNAGTGIAASFVSATPYAFRDASGRPIYGFTVSGTLTGTITPKTVTGTVTVPDRVYDATTAAVLNIGPLSGLVGTQTVVASASGSFADKNVGSNKSIAVSYQLANGTNGGLASNYQFVGPISPTGNITQRPLAVGGVTANNKVYDATAAATLAGTAGVTALAGDNVTLGGSAAANFNNKNVGTAKPVTVTGYTLTGTDAGNYSVVQPTGLTANITPRSYVSGGLTVGDKVYDATTAATLTGTASGSALPGDNVTVSGTATGTFADKNVGTGKAITLSGLTLSGTDAGNYSLVVPGLTASITPRSVSPTGISANNKVYDATTVATLSGTAAVTALSGDVLTVGGAPSASFINKNVGNGKAVTVAGYTLGGADAGNYSLVQPTGLSANITPRPLAVGGVTANNKVYDATTQATLSGTAGVAALAGDTVSVSGSGLANFNDKNVGTAKPVTVTGYTLVGADAGNYSVVQPTGLAANITPRAYVVGGLSAADKVYDATTAATVTGGASGTALGSDNVTVTGTAAGSFADKNVGTGKAVTLTGLSLSGTDAANYSLVLPGLTASITRRSVQLTGLTANNKVYDATTAATLSGTAAVTALSGDVLTVGGAPSASFANKNVGNGKAVTVAGYTLGGADAGNYSLVQPTGLAANITPRPLAVGGVTANNKVYDATTQATLTGSAGVTALAGDTVSVSGSGLANFNDKNVGTGKPVTVSGYTLTGADAGNYSVVQPTGLRASITPRAYVSGGLSAADKVYDGTTAATLVGSASGMALAGDNVTVSGTASGSFADKNVGTGKAVTLTGLTLSGTDAGNYSLVVPGLTASITPRSVSLTGISANNKVYDATTVATLSGTAAVTALSGDVLTVAGAPTANFANKNVGNGKAVTVTGYTLGGADAGNYALVQPTGLAANITPRPLAIAGLSAADKVYDATTAATLVGTAGVAGLAGDTVSLGGSGLATFNDKNVGSAKPVAVSGYTLTGSDAANYSLLTLNLRASITPRSVVVTGLTFNDKVYDATTAATLSGTAAVAALSGDVLSVSGAALARFSDKNVGPNKVVTVTGYTLAGADAGNYSVVQPTGQASITPRALAITGVSANNKVYDATTVATLSGAAAVTALAGDSVVLGGSGQASFNNKNVGTGKAVSVTGYQLGGADAGNYLLTLPQGLTAAITPLQLSVTGIAVAGKVYDATTTATLSGTAVVASLAGDAVAVAGTPGASYDNKNVGTAKPVTVTGFALSGADAGNYTLPGSQLLTGSITPRPLAVTGLSANGKVYDGGTAATLAGTAGVSAISGDVVQLGGAATARFADRNAGAAKPVAVTGYAITGADAGNYSLLQPQGLAATITPATLTYVADPAVRSVGQTIVDLTGSVTGFVGTEALSTATSGALVFTTPATPSSPAGNYAIQGGGLSATNYSFNQAPANAQALSVVDLSPTTTTIVGSVAPEVTSSIAAILAAPRQAADSGVANLTASVSIGADPGVMPVGDFRAVRLSNMSRSDIQDLLTGRDLYKKALLANSVQKLEDNPKLADLPECQTVAEAQEGRCLITDRVKALVARQPQVATPAGPTDPVSLAATPAAPTSATPAEVAQSATTPATPAPAATPPLVATAPPPAPAATGANVDPLLREVQLIRRRVLTASLPQIERKVALVIGVDNYSDKSIPALGNAVRDARSVAQLFESKLGYEAVVLPNASKSTLVGALNKLALTMGPRDSVVIYYAGHGQLVESTQLGYWLLADSGANDPESWLSNTDISRLIGQIGASQVALISDSCYSGSLVSEERIRAAPTALDPKAVLARKSVVIMSSGGNEPVFDEGRDGHSPFAWNLMNTLNKVADWQPGGNVFERVRFAVARELPQRPQYSASRAAGHQAGGDYLFEQRELAGGK